MSLWEGIERRAVCGLLRKTVAKSDHWLLCLAVRLGWRASHGRIASKLSLGRFTEVCHHIWLKPGKNNNFHGDLYAFVTTLVIKITFHFLDHSGFQDSECCYDYYGYFSHHVPGYWDCPSSFIVIVTRTRLKCLALRTFPIFSSSYLIHLCLCEVSGTYLEYECGHVYTECYGYLWVEIKP